MKYNTEDREITKIMDFSTAEVSIPLQLILTGLHTFKDDESDLEEHLYSPFSILENQREEKWKWRNELVVELTAMKEFCDKFDCAYFRIVNV